MKEEILRVENLSILSEEERMLKYVNFNLFKGELLSIFGSNESGNTNLAKTVAGFLSFTSGKIYISGRKATRYDYKKAQDMGIYYLGKDSMLISTMTVEENLFAIRKMKGFSFIYNKGFAREKTEVLREEYGFAVDVKKNVQELTILETMIVQIVKVLLMGAKIVILDDPKSNMSEYNYTQLLNFIRRQSEVSYIYISNVVDKIVESSDRIAIMRKGKIVKILYNEDYSFFYLNKCAHGQQQVNSPERKSDSIGEIIFRIKGIPIGKRTLNLSVAKREVVGILDLDGSCGEILEKLTEERFDGISINGEAVETYEAAVKKGMAVIKNRFDFNDYFSCFDESKNLTFQVLKKISRIGVINKEIEDFILKNLETEVYQFRGQSINWQILRTTLYRRLITNPKIIITDNIASGFDVEVSEELYRILEEAAKNDIGILAIFSDLMDCVNFCDKVYVPSNNENSFLMFSKNDKKYSGINALIESINKKLSEETKAYAKP